MKQYTTPEQTAKLIELGFVPKMRIKGVCTKYGTVNIEHETYFDVGWLIEMLPDYINGNFVNWKIQTIRGDAKWSVGWDCFETEQFQWIRTTELIDALYDMVVELKEKGVI